RRQSRSELIANEATSSRKRKSVLDNSSHRTLRRSRRAAALGPPVPRLEQRDALRRAAAYDKAARGSAEELGRRQNLGAKSKADGETPRESCRRGEQTPRAGAGSFCCLGAGRARIRVALGRPFCAFSGSARSHGG